MQNAVRAAEIVDILLSHGFSLMPVVFGEKKPFLDEWQKRSLSNSQVRQFFASGRYNIGVKNGICSGGSIDMDLDCPEAAKVAPFLLPPTPFRFGRLSNPDSHYFFRAKGVLPKTHQFHDERGKMLAEYRSTGSFTVAPGSKHPSGEYYEGQILDAPATVPDAGRLLQISRLVAAAARLLRAYPEEGGRHNFALKVAGCLAHAGLDKDDAVALISAVAQAANDTEVADRERCVIDCYRALSNGDNCYGCTALADCIGKPVVNCIFKILNLRVLSHMRDRIAAKSTAQNDDIEELERGHHRSILNTRSNVEQLLKLDKWGQCFGYDERADVMAFVRAPPLQGIGSTFPLQITDINILQIGVVLSKEHGVSFSTNNLWEGVNLVCNENKFDEVRDYLCKVEKTWDGVNRLDTFLTDYFSTECNAYTKMVGRMWMISAVARPLQPGCQVDHMLIFESPGQAESSPHMSPRISRRAPCSCNSSSNFFTSGRNHSSRIPTRQS